jgi:chemotaxis signal transduction protein/HPt (histidine-containing phosphotransfer) domain-containing protein
MDIDLSEYMGAYVDGCRENLDLMDKMLLILEQNPANLDAIKDIFRAAHTLKGMSATMGFDKIMHLTHEMENILDKMRNETLAVTTEVIDLLFETFDLLRTLVNDSIDATDSLVDISEITQKLQDLATNGPAAVSAPEPVSTPVAAAPEVAASQPAAPQAASSQPEESGGLCGGDEEALMALAEMALPDEDMEALAEIAGGGANLAILSVTLIEDCLLKGARVFMMLRALEEYDTPVLHASPSIKELEDERFDRSFKLLIQTKENLKQLCGELSKITEVETVECADLSALLSGSLSAPSVPPTPAPTPAPTAPAPAPAPAAPVVTPAPMAQPMVTPVVQEAPQPKVEAAPQAQSLAPAINPAAINTPKEEDPLLAGQDEHAFVREHQEIIQFVTFTMADEVYALEIQEVEAIINVIDITRVPKAPSYIDGVINLRGEIVPVINTRRRLRLKEEEIKPTDQIIILSFEEEKVKAGFLVDSVQEVTSLLESSIEPPSRVSESVNVEYLRGVGKVDGKIIILLNAHRIVFEKISSFK